MNSGGLIYKLTIGALALGICICAAILVHLLSTAPQAEVFTNAQLVREVIFHAPC